MDKLDGAITNISKRLKVVETIKASENQPSRIDKIEEVIETLGSTLSALKTKNVEAMVGKKPKFMYVPKNPLPKTISKTNSQINEGGTSKTMEEVSNLSTN